MARKASTTKAKQVGPVLETSANAEAIEEEAQARGLMEAETRHLAKIDETFGDQLPYDQSRLESECRFYMQQSATSMLEAGNRLVVLKEHEAHGDFTQSLERIGIAPRAARKLMQAAVKFTGAKRPLAAVLGKAKVFELMAEDDDDLESLSEGGTLAGLSLDDIDCMSSNQLRDTLRKERDRKAKDDAANEKIIAKKDEKINELDRQISRVHDWPEIVDSLNFDITMATGKVIVHLLAVRKLMDRVLEEAGEHDLSDGQVGIIVEKLNPQILLIAEQMTGLSLDFDNNLSGYLNLPDETLINADEGAQ